MTKTLAQKREAKARSHPINAELSEVEVLEMRRQRLTMVQTHFYLCLKIELKENPTIVISCFCRRWGYLYQTVKSSLEYLQDRGFINFKTISNTKHIEIDFPLLTEKL